MEINLHARFIMEGLYVRYHQNLFEKKNEQSMCRPRQAQRALKRLRLPELKILST
jgi:hypothetical protein